MMVSLTRVLRLLFWIQREQCLVWLSDSLRMSVIVGRTSRRGLAGIVSNTEILGTVWRMNLFNKLFRNWCKREKWGARKCELTVVFLLCHTRKAVLKCIVFVCFLFLFWNIAEDAWKLLEIINRRKIGFCLFCPRDQSRCETALCTLH